MSVAPVENEDAAIRRHAKAKENGYIFELSVNQRLAAENVKKAFLTTFACFFGAFWVRNDDLHSSFLLMHCQIKYYRKHRACGTGFERAEPNAIVIIDGIARRKNSFVGCNFSKISESIV